MTDEHILYDAAVIGAGAAGLNAALTLGRARRSVLVIDAGQQRNAPARSMHNYLGHEGITPTEFLDIAGREVSRFGGERVTASVTAAARETETNFRLELDNGATVRARRLLLATGLVDELPDVPGIAERWARDVLHCPYCHGWEVRDQPIGVLATSAVGVEQALLWSQWSDRVTLLAHTGPVLDGTARKRLAARSVRVVEGEVRSLDVVDDRLTGVLLAGGQRVDLTRIVVAPRFTARVTGLDGLGLEVTDWEMFGQVAGSFVAAGPQGATSVAGVFAAGNVTSVTETAIGSAAAGLKAAAGLNLDLITEDTQRAMTV
ncbi:NAD(P)/FAD-dependent oxidoreductase [Streptomyces sp. ISL-12]|uniref:NAD(P)/FAD-dependent oxidoreductase n=1 Tax=Streptomyces sp. ISL-12 TaxID=2819177 RepID=UPI001BED3957|nr:NAD(P)/FAD-dependent oxidoreductase [Streptomyces sp. ISL-12]MBT2413294.1 NAD(P)/FAD-dependent oxidoreductase [Streptomyces sp. ISL-12]